MAGAQIIPFLTQIIAGGQTMVVLQVWEALEATLPHGPVPVALKKSVFVPHTPRIVWVGMAAPVWACSVPMGMMILVTVPSPRVMTSVTLTPVRAALPQFDTVPETL